MIHVSSLFALFHWVLCMAINIVEVLEVPAIN